MAATSQGDEADLSEDSRIVLPIDVLLEIVVGLLVGIIGTIMKYTANLDSISHQEITGLTTKTAEMSNNLNRGSGLRNLQRSRGGPIFTVVNCRI